MTHWLYPLNWLFDLLFWPFRNAAPAWPLLLASVLAGVLIVVAFRYTSNQKAVRRAKDRLAAHVMEVRLFQEQLGVIAGSYARILRAMVVYLGTTVKPLLVILVPLLLIFAQLELRLGHQPAKPAANLLVKARFAEGASLTGTELRLPEGVVQTAPALHIEEEREVDWRIRAERAGVFEIAVVDGETSVAKQIVVGGGLQQVSPVRTGSFWTYLLYPGEAPVARGSVVSVETLYPAREVRIFGWGMHWMIPFLVFSLAAAYAVKGWLRTEF